MGIWKYGNMEIWEYGNMGIWEYGKSILRHIFLKNQGLHRFFGCDIIKLMLTILARFSNNLKSTPRGGGVFRSFSIVFLVSLFLLPILLSTSVFSTSSSGNVNLTVEVSGALAMKIVSPNDINPDCTPESNVTYGIVNRYDSGDGTSGSKKVDTFDGNTGAVDEINTNTSCATLTMNANSYSSTYSDVTVYTNAKSGYALSLSSPNPNLTNTTNFNGTDSSHPYTIPAGVLQEETSGNTTVVPGGQNLWSYKTDNGIITSWTALSTTDTTIKAYGSSTSGGGTTRVTYGISSGTSPSGKYEATMTYTATVFDAYNPYTPNFFNITKMQEMTRDICQDYRIPTPAANETTTLTKSAWESGSRTGIPTTTLLDDRGNPKKSYTVKKLADGQCWMTENLALPGGTVLSADDSDIDGTVVSSYTVPTSLGTSNFSNSPAQDVAQMTDYYADTTDDPRGYETGGYYSWRAATAGTGRGSGTDGSAENDVFGTNMNTQGNNTSVSICPKGWRLPTGGSGAGTTSATTPGSTTGLTNGDFARLFQAYNGGTGTSGSDTTMYAQMTGTSYGPQFALGGSVNIFGRYGQNSAGTYWSSTNYSYQSAYYLYLATVYIDSQDGNYKYNGRSVRCIAR